MRILISGNVVTYQSYMGRMVLERSFETSDIHSVSFYKPRKRIAWFVKQFPSRMEAQRYMDSKRDNF